MRMSAEDFFLEQLASERTEELESLRVFMRGSWRLAFRRLQIEQYGRMPSNSRSFPGAVILTLPPRTPNDVSLDFASLYPHVAHTAPSPGSSHAAVERELAREEQKRSWRRATPADFGILERKR